MKVLPPTKCVIRNLTKFAQSNLLRLSIVSSLVSGCSLNEHSFQPTQNDLDRVSNILQQPKRNIGKTIPVISTWQTPILSETRIRLSDALALGECGLVPLVAERNSILGKHKQESTRFIYEWKLMFGLRSCDLSIDQEAWFQEVLKTKTSDIKNSALRILVESDEAEEARSQRSVSLTLDESMKIYKSSFTKIRQLILKANASQAPPTDSQVSQFESALRDFASSHHHGRLGKAIRITNAWLAEAVAIQTQAVRDNRICPLGSPTEDSQIVEAFVSGYFADKILPKFSKIDQAYRQMNELWHPLIQYFYLPEEFLNSQILRINNNTFEQLTRRLREHVELWQVVLNKCQLNARATTTKRYSSPILSESKIL